MGRRRTKFSQQKRDSIKPTATHKNYSEELRTWTFNLRHFVEKEPQRRISKILTFFIEQFSWFFSGTKKLCIRDTYLKLWIKIRETHAQYFCVWLKIRKNIRRISKNIFFCYEEGQVENLKKVGLIMQLLLCFHPTWRNHEEEYEGSSTATGRSKQSQQKPLLCYSRKIYGFDANICSS